MPFSLSDDEQMIRDMVRQFATDVVGLDAAQERDRYDAFPTEAVQAAAGLGLTGMGISADDGGAGVTPTAMAAAIDEVARVDPALAAVLAVHNAVGLRLLLDAPDALRSDLVPRAVGGELVAHLVTEEASGSDTGGIGTALVPADDGFVLSGRKTWGVAASDAPHFLVLGQGPEGPTWAYVPRDAKGVTIAANDPIMGLRAAGMRVVYFDQVAVPAEHIVGAPGAGLELLEVVRPWLKVAAASILNGAITGSLAAAARFAQDRVQFGRPIGTYQAVSGTVMDMDTTVAASRALTLQAAGRLDEDDAAAWAARAKAFANEAAVPLTRSAIRVQGGTGFMREGGTERFARDVRTAWFFGETTQMQQELLKRHVLPDIDWDAPEPGRITL